MQLLYVILGQVLPKVCALHSAAHHKKIFCISVFALHSTAYHKQYLCSFRMYAIGPLRPCHCPPSVVDQCCFWLCSTSSSGGCCITGGSGDGTAAVQQLLLLLAAASAIAAASTQLLLWLSLKAETCVSLHQFAHVHATATLDRNHHSRLCCCDHSCNLDRMQCCLRWLEVKYPTAVSTTECHWHIRGTQGRWHNAANDHSCQMLLYHLRWCIVP